MFQLTKTVFLDVLQQITPHLSQQNDQTGISNTIKLAATLRFLAQGNYQHGIGEEMLLSLSQPIVSQIIAEVCDAIETVISPKVLNTYMTKEEKQEAKQFFYNETGFPGVIGVIDGTFIQIIEPRSEKAQGFVNRKHKHSLNSILV